MRKIRTSNFILLSIVMIITFVAINWRMQSDYERKISKLEETIERKDNVLRERLIMDEFSLKELEKELEKLHIKYPKVVLAQSILETGYYSSDIFIENNNLFGMRVARVRPTTNIGKNLGHAMYSDWKNSVYDFKLWQDSLTDIDTEQQYIEKIDRIYSESNNYSETVKRIMKRL